MTGATSYKLYRATSSGGTYTQTGGTISATSYTDSGLNAGTTYWYKAVAVNASGDSAYSAALSGTTLPAAPTGLSAVAASPTQINLSWADNASNEGGYKVERSSDNSTWSLVKTTTSGVTSWSDTGLSEGSHYYYRIYAYLNTSNSAYATANTYTKPTAPAFLSVTVTSTTQITLTWGDNSTHETGYRVERSADGATNWTVCTTMAANLTSWIDQPLQEGLPYYYRVCAVVGGVNSGYATAGTGCLLIAPASLSAEVTSATQVKLSWTDRATIESGYKINRSADAGVSWTLVQTTGADIASWSDSGVNEGQSYLYRVYAFKDSFLSASVTVSVRTTPRSPVRLVAVADDSSTPTQFIRVSWVDTSTCESSFSLERSPNGVNNWAVIATPAASPGSGQPVTLVDHYGITEGTHYWYRVRAYLIP